MNVITRFASRSWLLSVGVVGWQAIAAASPLEASIRACALEPQPAERLACFDAAAKALPGSDRALAAPPLAVAPAPSASASTAASTFGLRPAATERVNHVQSRIVGAFDGWEQGTVITLENGQRWRVVEASTRYMPVRDPQAIVREGMLGAYFLQVVGSSVQVRVRRVP